MDRLSEFELDGADGSAPKKVSQKCETEKKLTLAVRSEKGLAVDGRL